MKYGCLFLIFFILMLSVPMVSASDNATDVVLSNVTSDGSQIDLNCDDNNQTVTSCPVEDKNQSVDVKDVPETSKKKVAAAIKTKNFKTYHDSESYFKAKITNKATKKPIKGVKVLFSVYSSKNKHFDYYAKTNSKGVATLNKNLKVGNYVVNKAIEKIAGKMVSSGKIKMSSLKKIKSLEQSLGIGHFAIKAPNGKYAVVWKNSIKTGKLKNGKYISVPNQASSFRHGSYAKLDKNPKKATLKVGATDAFGVNRRDITVYHWKKANNNFKASSSVKVYASNDDGKMVGRYTAGLKDNIQFKGKFISKNSLSKAPKMKSIGSHKFGNIDKLVKTKTVVKAPDVANYFNKTKYFKVTVKDKKTKKALSNVKIRLKLTSNDTSRKYALKTDKNGVAKFDTQKLAIGIYKVVISQANNKYLISAKSKIEIKSI